MNQLARTQSPEGLKESWYQRAERFDPVRRRDKNDDGNWQGIEVLLMLQILIGGQKRVKFAGCKLQ